MFLVVCVASVGFGGCGSSPQTRADHSGTNGLDGGQMDDQGASMLDAARADSATGDAATGASAVEDAATDAGCACPASEPCCDEACGFRPATYRCSGPLEATRVRNVCTETCGGTAVPEFEVQYCTGSSAACDGATAWYDTILCGIVPPCYGFRVCDAGARCVPFGPMPVANLTSMDMLCETHASCGL